MKEFLLDVDEVNRMCDVIRINMVKLSKYESGYYKFFSYNHIGSTLMIKRYTVGSIDVVENKVSCSVDTVSINDQGVFFDLGNEHKDINTLSRTFRESYTTALGLLEELKSELNRLPQEDLDDVYKFLNIER